MRLPLTLHELDALTCISALQKHIRRGNEAEAMKFACELWHTSKSYASMVAKRLQIICHEDIDNLANPTIAPFVKTACRQAIEWYNPEKPGTSRIAIGNAIRLMCRAQKSREGDHFQAAIGLANEVEGTVPEIPNFALDWHTAKGRRMGRGLDHFRAEGARLHPPLGPDRYENEAYRLWAIKAARTTHRLSVASARRPRPSSPRTARKLTNHRE